MFMMVVDNFQVTARLEPKDGSDAQEIYLRVPETSIREVFDVLVFNGATSIHMERSSHAFAPKYEEVGDPDPEPEFRCDNDDELSWP